MYDRLLLSCSCIHRHAVLEPESKSSERRIECAILAVGHVVPIKGPFELYIITIIRLHVPHLTNGIGGGEMSVPKGSFRGHTFPRLLHDFQFRGSLCLDNSLSPASTFVFSFWGSRLTSGASFESEMDTRTQCGNQVRSRGASCVTRLRPSSSSILLLCSSPSALLFPPSLIAPKSGINNCSHRLLLSLRGPVCHAILSR